MKIISKSIEINGKSLTLEIGRFAVQANAAALARYGDTIVLATVVSSQPREDLDYFPLSVEYIERLYAGGRIKGSRWVKREGRPSDEAILTARLIDRSIRPLFPEGYKNEVQVMITVLSVDAENDADVPAICAVSAALSISDIPWNGPVGAVRIGFVPQNGEVSFIANPTYQDLGYSEMDLMVSGTKEGVVMIEGGARIVSEEVSLKAIDYAGEEIKKIIALIDDLVKKTGKKKQTFKTESVDARLAVRIEKEIREEVKALVQSMAVKKESGERLEEIKAALVEKYPEEKRLVINKIVGGLLKKIIRERILKGKRPDGREPEEIRPIEIEVGLLPRTHGSAMFQRGNTQALTVTTLGSPSLEQLIESMEGEETKRYMHHYYFPPFCVGEVRRQGWPSRREIGHGSLAETALLPVIPSEDKFPYAIRMVSEIMSSNGSSSMASVCGSSLSLMDAGVPIKFPVAGIAMGMVSDGEKRVILSDILGMEDFNGDMDFKIAGTEEGITALQMDVKDVRLTIEDLRMAFKQARKGRLFILEKMRQVLPAARAQISEFAPKVQVLRVPIDKIGSIIGPGGRTIKQLISETGASIDVEDDGTVNISAIEKKSVDEAVLRIEALTKEVKAGDVFEGTVRRIQPFGAFVEILPGKDGLVHVSRMSSGYISHPSEVVKMDQKVKVRVTEIDDLGRINLSMLFGEEALKKQESGRDRDWSRDRGRGSGQGRSRDRDREKRDNFSPKYHLKRPIEKKTSHARYRP